MNSNKRSDSRKSYSNGPANGHAGRSKGRSSNRGVTMDGVYGNLRFSYGVTSLIGCPVRLQVKNGAHYEGIFLTFSPKMEIVLQMAHQVEDEHEGPINKDQVIDAMIFKVQDVTSIIATNVDLDYATKDAFTDSAISKFNGQVIGRELERWDCDGPGMDLSLESNANGWDAEQMFKTNAEKYNVKSSYDSDLSAYTTTLEVDNTAEGRAKSARAAKLASEIEGTDEYRVHMELENLEGEQISSVIRDTQAREPASDVYIPPARRKQHAAQQQARNSAAKSTVSVNGAETEPGTASPKQSVSSPSAKPRNRDPVNEKDSEQDKNKKNLLSSPSSSSPLPSSSSSNSSDAPSTASTDTESKAKDERDSKQASPVPAPQHKLQHSKSANTRPDDHTDFPAPAASASHHAKTKPDGEHKKGRDDRKAEITELRDFSDKFNIKLPTDSDTKEKRSEPKRAGTQTGDAPAPQTGESRTTPQKTDSDASQADESKEKKKSTLNPNAPEFTLNPNAREFKPAVNVSTSPRPHTQSPVIPQAIAIHPPQQIFSYMAGTLMNAQMQMPPEQQAMQKRTIVVRPDPSAQALAATGTPLQAQPAGGMPGAPQYLPFVLSPSQMPQNFAQGQTPIYNQQVVQVTQNGHRLMSQMGAQMPLHQYPQQMANMNMAQQQQQQQHVYIHSMSQPQPPPQMMPPNQHPQHYAHQRSTPPQPASHNPNPASQPQNPPQQQQQHPQQQIYHPNGQIPPQGQPPLQPSPHTPASPQAQQPPVIPMSMSYAYSQPPIPTQTHNPAMHQMASNYMQVAPQVSYTAHHTHGPAQHQNLMMVQQPHQHLQGQHHLAHGPPQMQAQMQAPVHMSQSGPPLAGPQPGMQPMNVPSGHY